MVIEVKKISDFKEVDVSKLIQESEKEGYRFVTRLKEEYEDGTNRFSEQGEALYGVWEDKELVSIGGLTKNTITTEDDNQQGSIVFILYQIIVEKELEVNYLKPFPTMRKASLKRLQRKQNPQKQMHFIVQMDLYLKNAHPIQHMC